MRCGLDFRKERGDDGIKAPHSATSLELRNTPPTVLWAIDKPTIDWLTRPRR
jgi:hypothetical protein